MITPEKIMRICQAIIVIEILAIAILYFWIEYSTDI